MQQFWILSSCAHACVCVHVWKTDWPGLNSAKTARQLNISGEARTCQSRQRRLQQSHNFICQMSMKLNDFRDTLLNESILFSFKKDWKKWTQWLARSGVKCSFKRMSTVNVCGRNMEKHFKMVQHNCIKKHHSQWISSMYRTAESGKSYMLCPKAKMWQMTQQSLNKS